MNGLILHLKNSKDTILKNLCNDFLNRRIWHILDDNDQTQEQIAHIKQQYHNQNRAYIKYYTSSNSAFQNAYSESKPKFETKILIKSKGRTQKSERRIPIIKV
ncbi:hypothetical protein ACEW7V_03350 [Areca yellow leaf disease phytoplasma]|uniref:hypothetical protein n=1 Tax=Areca yellow leaf disease phytoplasma TaxID=927614 RepID=UPI0035B53BD0